ncbi:myosin light chain kinase, smooth muscle-like [Oncorhynchus keta]|uniref:myosin light chain kinase, smooth muscle-like n=1 Tax=Oncorhynchus keta TaxID=8018 RepID=UPI0015FC9C79|nr:myosin light chain kinase, smooth muscle-like [Oncorhynchus keta]
MDKCSMGSKKTFVSTFRMDFKPAAPRQFVLKGIKNELEDRDTARGGSSKQGTISTDITSKRRVSTEKGPLLEFLDPQEQLEVRVGGQAKLHCAFRSCSVPVASCWIYNREQVVAGRPRTRVESSDTDSSVEISQACPDDAGTYTILVRNRRGLAQHTVTLSVIDRPHPPASSPMVSQLSSCSLVLSWSGPSYDGGTAVTGYAVEVRREGTEKPEDWTEVTTRCKNTSYRIRSVLEPLGEYRFRVRAYNLAGVSEPSEVSDCVKMDTRGEPKVESQSYVTVTIDTTHKVKDHYNVHEKLGVGKFGQVFRLSHKETGQVCAGKFYRAHSSKAKAVARREIELMNCLHHPKLVQCLGAYDTRSEIIMVMEYIAGGELFERIADDNFEHTEPTSARYMHQLLEGMQYIHRQNIVHLDLKPENIVCVDTTGTRIKIIDFGLAAKLEPGTPLMVMHGTPDFVAPEVISYEPVGLATDMWSIGVICFILLSGELPFQGNSDAETLSLVTAARYEFDQESFEDISDQAKDFITSLLKKDTRCRLLCDEALAHPWMASFTLLVRRPTKSLKKDKIRRFLAKRRWKKTGKAVLALQRMANLTNGPDTPGSLGEEASWSPAAEQAIQTLDQELQSEPRFQQVLRDTSQPRGSSARLACRVQGYPEPEVVWFKDEETVESSSRVTVGYDGMCELVLTDLGPADTGVYKCRATNVLGEALCSAKLTVEL